MINLSQIGSIQSYQRRYLIGGVIPGGGGVIPLPDTVYGEELPRDDYYNFGGVVLVSSLFNDTSTYESMINGSSYIALGQSFVGNGGDLYGGGFYVRAVGVPTGNLYLRLYSHSGTFGTSSVPTTTLLASSPAFDVETLYQIRKFVTFLFGATYTTTSGTNYVLVIEYSGGTSTDYIDIGVDTTIGMSGNFSRKASTTWSAVSGTDMLIELYGTNPLVESSFGIYDFANGDQYNYIAATQNTKMAQSFTGIAGAFSKITVELRATGSPTGNVTASLFADDGGTFGTTGKPTGTALATSTAITASSISTVGAQYTFTFASPYTMTEGTVYWIALEYSSGSSSNKIGVVVDISSPTSPGRLAYYNGSTWAFTTYDNTGTSGATDDLCYNIYALS